LWGGGDHRVLIIRRAGLGSGSKESEIFSQMFSGRQAANRACWRKHECKHERKIPVLLRRTGIDRREASS
jgi:hypothetical protein